jgi:hypothetical protein
MTTFTIDTDNNITAHGTPGEAAATTATPFDTFASQKELAELATGWPAERLVAIWSSLPGVTPVKKFQGSDDGRYPDLEDYPEPRGVSKTGAGPTRAAESRA